MKGKRTFYFTLTIYILLPIIDFAMANGKHVMELFSSPKTAAATLFAMGILQIILRVITTTPIFKATAKDQQVVD